MGEESMEVRRWNLLSSKERIKRIVRMRAWGYLVRPSYYPVLHLGLLEVVRSGRVKTARWIVEKFEFHLPVNKVKNENIPALCSYPSGLLMKAIQDPTGRYFSICALHALRIFRAAIKSGNMEMLKLFHEYNRDFSINLTACLVRGPNSTTFNPTLCHALLKGREEMAEYIYSESLPCYSPWHPIYGEKAVVGGCLDFFRAHASSPESYLVVVLQYDRVEFLPLVLGDPSAHSLQILLDHRGKYGKIGPRSFLSLLERMNKMAAVSQWKGTELRGRVKCEWRAGNTEFLREIRRRDTEGMVDWDLYP